MQWPEDQELVERFPPPHEGEPSSLRQDIMDDLRDHLACAMERELADSDDENEARKRVLDQFGYNPGALARQLWFESMKEKIMKDRMVLVGIFILIIIGICGLFLIWQSNQQTNRAMMAMIESFKSGEDASQFTTRLDLASVSISVFRDEKETIPASGIKIEMYKINSSNQNIRFYQTTDENGVAVIGPVQTGNYKVYFPWEKYNFSPNDSDINLFGGKDIEKTIIYPKYQICSITIEPVLPKNINSEDVVVGISYGTPTSEFGRLTLEDSRSIMILPDGSLYNYNRSGVSGLDSLIQYDSLSNFELPSYPVHLSQIYVADARNVQLDHDKNKVYPLLGFFDYRKGLRPTFYPQPGKINTWRISIPDELVREISGEFLAVAEQERIEENINALGSITDPSLARMIQGRVRSAIAIHKDTYISAEHYEDVNGHENDLYIWDNLNGGRILIGLPEIPDHIENYSNMKYYLAFYAAGAHTTFAPGLELIPTSSQIGLFRIMEPWKEEVTWITKPLAESSPLFTFNFEPTAEIWKLIELTDFMLSLEESHGFMIRFIEEHKRDHHATVFEFYSSDAQGNQLRYRPLLIITEDSADSDPSG